VAFLVVDDHLLRGALTLRPARRVGAARARGELATTELYYHRLCSSLARPSVAGRLSAPVAALDTETQDQFRQQLVALPGDIRTLPIRDLAWRMAVLKERYPISTLVAEALAAAEALQATIAVDEADVGPHMRSAARDLVVRLVTIST
jgi:hypothetical protein